MSYLTIALAKGRLAEKSVELFSKAGVAFGLDEGSRRLIFTNEERRLKIILSKAGDVPTYVEYGAADLGVVGKDTLMEEKRNIYEVMDLKFGNCKMVAAGYEKNSELLRNGNNFRVATKYPAITGDYFRGRKQTVEIIKMTGSVELAAVSGLADMIVDLVSTGTTLKENGLIVFSDIADISARLVINRVSLKMEHDRITGLITGLRGALK